MTNKKKPAIEDSWMIRLFGILLSWDEKKQAYNYKISTNKMGDKW